jgi:hypothetical protein
VEVVAVKKRKPTKKKTVPSKEGVGCLIHIDDNLMARMKIFQSYMKEENGITLKTAPTVKFLVNAGLKQFEKNNAQLDLMGAIASKKKKSKS